jgi:hypothetical protein
VRPRPFEAPVTNHIFLVVIVVKIFVVRKRIAQSEAAEQIQHGGGELEETMTDTIDAIPHGLP